MFFVLNLFLLIGCGSADTPHLDYCLIFKNDQSNLEPTLIANEKRSKIIFSNWKLLLHELQSSPNLKVGISKTGPDSCKYYAYLATLTHISQSWPEELYTLQRIKLIEQKINERVIDKNLFYTACKVTSFGEYKKDFKPLFLLALKSWKLDTTIFNRTTFH